MKSVPSHRARGLRLAAVFGWCTLWTLDIFTPAIVHAQGDTGAQIGTQQDLIRRGNGGTDEQRPGFLVSDPELGELELVARAPRPKTFTFSTDQNFFYTTNAFLAPEGEQGTAFWNGRVLASAVPYATRNFTPRLTFEQNFFRYAEFQQLNFDSQSLALDLKFDFKPDDSCFANLSYTAARLYSPEDGVGEFYRYGLLNGSATHVWKCSRLPIQVAGSFGSNWRHGDPSDFDRATIYLNTVLIYQPLETVQVAAFVRPEVQFYLSDPNSSSRTDFNFSAGASATWTPIEYFSMGVTGSFTGNWSSANRQDYNVFLPSIVLSGRASF